MKTLQKPYYWALIYSLILVIFTTYVFLDTFIVAQSIVDIPLDIPIVNPPNIPSDDPIFCDSVIKSDTYYCDTNIVITLTKSRQYNSNFFVADIRVKSLDYLKRAFAKDVYGRNINQKTSTIARKKQAILAINGDFYGARSKGYVLVNSILYRDKAAKNQEDLVIWPDATFSLIKESQTTAKSLLSQGARDVFSFGPGLLNKGLIIVGKKEEVADTKTTNPRTAIGIIKPLHYVFVVVDGRTKASKGVTLYQLASFLQTLQVDIGYNLDGGGSSTMYFNGKVVNKPTFDGSAIKERSVSDIVYVGY